MSHLRLLSEGDLSHYFGVLSGMIACCHVPALTVEEAQERRERLAKMRSLLFTHEQKAKRLKAIKSKGFHRHAKKAAKMKVRFLVLPFDTHGITMVVSGNTLALLLCHHIG